MKEIDRYILTHFHKIELFSIAIHVTVEFETDILRI